MFEYLALSDGTTTLELTDNIDYALASYAPQISAIRDSLLGGQSPYATVQDTITVHAMGCTAADAYAAAGALTRMIDTAKRWWREENNTPVLIRAKVQNSANAPLRSLIYGPPPGTGQPVILPPQFSEYYGKYVIQNLSIQFVRDGQWLGGTIESAASANATHPTIHTCTFATAARTHTPIDLSLSGGSVADVFNYQQGYVLIAPLARLNLTEGEVTLTSTNGVGNATRTTVADAADVASAGNVQRWTGTTTFTGEINNRVTLGAGMVASRQPISVFAAVRFNSASIVTGVWRAVGERNGAALVQTPDLLIDYAGGLPQIIFLGLLQARGGLDTINLQFDGVLPIGLSFDIDYIASISLDDEASQVVGLADFVTGQLSSVGGTIALELRANAQTDPTPAVRVITQFGVTAYLGYVGNPYLMQIGSDVSMILLSTGSGNAWRPATTAPVALSGVLTASRRVAYLTPE